jgi:hypothetical protein
VTDGLDISGGNIVVTTAGRKVIDTAGHYVMGLPSSIQSITKAITYPDPPKAYWYNWRWYTFDQGGGGTSWYLWNAGALWVSLLPQEWQQDTVVCPAATVADGTPLGFLGKVRLNRTKAPSHNVNTAALSMRVPTNVWIPNSGSMLLEYVEFGVARTLTLMISGGNLILRQRQSIVAAFVTGADGGYGTYGDSGSGTIPSGTGQQGGAWWSLSYTKNSDGSRNTGAAYLGIPVFHDASRDNLHALSETTTPTNNPGVLQTCNPFSFAEGSTYINAFQDPTDYSSTYTVDIEGEFVRLT